MRRRHLAAGALALATLTSAPLAARAQQPVEIQFWHGLSQPAGGQLEQIVAEFNASQPRYKVAPTFRGSYPETMVAAIAAFRASTAPQIVQMFEVGTGTMMSAGRAVKPLHEMLAETGVAIDTRDFIGPVAGYYSAADGRMMALPFNSSTLPQQLSSAPKAFGPVQPLVRGLRCSPYMNIMACMRHGSLMPA